MYKSFDDSLRSYAGIHESHLPSCLGMDDVVEG